MGRMERHLGRTTATPVAVTCVLALTLLPACSIMFPFEAAPKDEEVRLPPPENAPRFDEDPWHESPPEKGNRLGAALAAGHFSRPLSGQDDVELAAGAPGADGGVGRVVRFLKTAAGGESMDALLPGTFGIDAARAHFGAALAAADFDDDGYDDLAIGAPDDGAAGSVVVYYGGPGPRWTRLRPPPAGGKRSFGAALAAGQIDGSPGADLVIGEPGSDRLFPPDAARVWVVWGRTDAALITMAGAARIAVPAGDEQRNSTLFGASLTVGNFVARADPSQPILPDVAIGAPRFDRLAVRRKDVGRVYVFQPVQPDPRTDGFALAATLEPRDGWESYAKWFGHVLVAGNFNGDQDLGEDAVDLAIGAPESSIPEQDGLDSTFGLPSGRGRSPGAGLVFLAPRTAGAVSTALRVLSQDRMGLSEKSDNFGWSLAAADFDRDGLDDLAIGSPNERMVGPDLSGERRMGALYFRFGNAGAWAVGGGIPQVPHACFDYTDAVRGRTFSRSGDRFGAVLLPALDDGDAAIDLVVGAPETDVESGRVVRDAGAVWVGRNATTLPGPFEGYFEGDFRDDACSNEPDPAGITLEVRNRDHAVCGILATTRDLCFEARGEQATVRQIDVSVVAHNLADETSMHLEYVVRDPDRRKVGDLQADATVVDAASDLTLDLDFRGKRGLKRDFPPIVLERQ